MKDWLNEIDVNDFTEFLDNESKDASQYFDVDKNKIGDLNYLSISRKSNNLPESSDVIFIGPYGVVLYGGKLDVTYSPFFTGTTRHKALNFGNTDFLVFMLNHIPENEREVYYEEYLAAHESAIYIFVARENETISKEIEAKQREIVENNKVYARLDKEIYQLQEKVKQENGIEPPEQEY